MATDINSQIIKSYAAGDPAGTGAFQEEIQNQQLNEALNAGTVDGILMKTGYGAVYDHHVVIKKDLVAFVNLTEVTEEILATPTYDFGDYATEKALYVKSNATPAGISIPTTAHIRRRGEIAIDNFDGSLYLLGNGGLDVVKVDAGSVNGFVIEADVTAANYVDKQAVKDLINSAFSYDAGTNSLTIKAI